MFASHVTTTVLAATACTFWIVAGIALLRAAARSRARADYLAGLGLLIGGLASGLATLSLDHEGIYPVAALVLSMALLWSFGTGQGDEATALQKGDRWLPMVGLATLGLLMQSLPDMLGPAPKVHLLIALRPVDLPVALLLLYLWHQVKGRPQSFFQALDARQTRELVLAVAAACLSGGLGDDFGNTFSYVFLCLAPAPFLVRTLRADAASLAPVGAVAVISLLVFHAMAQGRSMREQHRLLQSVMADASAITLDHAWLQTPVDTAAAEWVHGEAEVIYSRMARDVRKRLQRLRTLAEDNEREDLLSACFNFGAAMAAHTRWSRDTFQSVGLRRAAWGDDQAVARAESRAASARKESQLAHQRGRLALQALEVSVNDELEELGSAMASMRSTHLALLFVLALLGTAFMRSDTARRMLVRAGAPPPARAQSRILLVDDQGAAQTCAQQILLNDDVVVTLATAGENTERLLATEPFDLVVRLSEPAEQVEQDSLVREGVS